MDWLILVGAGVLAWLAWKYPGRCRGARVCGQLGGTPRDESRR